MNLFCKFFEMEIIRDTYWHDMCEHFYTMSCLAMTQELDMWRKLLCA